MSTVIASANDVVRHFVVDRTKTPQEMIEAFEHLRKGELFDKKALATMPTDCMVGEGELVFFLGRRNIPAQELDCEFRTRGLVPDPVAQMQVNFDDVSFAGKFPNGVQWWDNEGRLCCMNFSGSANSREVRVFRPANAWFGEWYFGGRKAEQRGRSNIRVDGMGRIVPPIAGPFKMWYKP